MSRLSPPASQLEASIRSDSTSMGGARVGASTMLLTGLFGACLLAAVLLHQPSASASTDGSLWEGPSEVHQDPPPPPEHGDDHGGGGMAAVRAAGELREEIAADNEGKGAPVPHPDQVGALPPKPGNAAAVTPLLAQQIPPERRPAPMAGDGDEDGDKGLMEVAGHTDAAPLTAEQSDQPQVSSVAQVVATGGSQVPGTIRTLDDLHRWRDERLTSAARTRALGALELGAKHEAFAADLQQLIDDLKEQDLDPEQVAAAIDDWRKAREAPPAPTPGDGPEDARQAFEATGLPSDLVTDLLLGGALDPDPDPLVSAPHGDLEAWLSGRGLETGPSLTGQNLAEQIVPGVGSQAPAPAEVIVRAATGEPWGSNGSAPGVVPATTAPEGALPAWAVDAERWAEEHSGGLALGLGAAGLGAGLFMGGGRGLFGGGGSYDPIVQEFLWAE